MAPGSMFEIPGDTRVKFDGNVRLCFAWEDERNLVDGVERMRNVAERLVTLGAGSGEYVIVEKKDASSIDEYK